LQMSMVSWKCFLVLVLFASYAFAGSALPTRILVLADALEHMDNLYNAIASRFTGIATITSFSDNTFSILDSTCNLCNPIPPSYAFVVLQTEVQYETSPDWPLIKSNIEDFVNAGRIFLITGESVISNNNPSTDTLSLIGAKDYVTISTSSGVSGIFTDYPTCDPLLKGFFGDIRGDLPGSYPGAQEDQNNVDVTIVGAGQTVCWELSYPEIAAGGRFTTAQKDNGGFLIYMQCSGASDYDQFLTGFYRVVYNNAIDYAFLLQDGALNVPPTQYRDFLVVSNVPSKQLGSPINGLYQDFYVPLVDIYGNEDPTASILGAPIDAKYEVVVVVLSGSSYSTAPNFATYEANLQAFADAGGLVIFYGATPEITSDPAWIPLLGGSGANTDPSGLSSSFGSFAECSTIINGPFGTYIGLNPRNLDATLTANFQNAVDTLATTTATSCLDSNAGGSIISYENQANGGLIVYLASHFTGFPGMDNFQDITLDWYRDVYNNIISNQLGLTGSVGGDPHIFTFGGSEIELAFQNAKHYVFYGSHDFSVVIGTVGFLDTIFIAEVGVTMGSFRLHATQFATRPIFKLNGEEITENVHTPIGQAVLFDPQETHLRGALSELAPYLVTGIRIGDSIEIVGGYYAPFIFYNIEIIRSAPSTEFGLLHAAKHQSKRDVDFLQQFETANIF